MSGVVVPVSLATEDASQKLAALNRKIADLAKNAKIPRFKMSSNDGLTTLDSNTKAVTKNLNKLGNEGQKTFNKIDRASNKSTYNFNRLNIALKGAAVAFASFQTVKFFANTADDFVLLDNKLKNITNSQADFNNAIKETRRISISTRSDLNAITTLFSKISLSGKEFNLSQQDAARVTKTVAQSLKLSGANAQEANSAIIQLGQALASGRLQGDEFRSLSENAPIFTREIAKALSTTIAGLREMSTAGELSTDKILRASLKAEAAVQRAFNKTTITLAESVGNLSQAVKIAFDSMARYFFSAFPNIAKYIDKVANRVLMFAEDFEYHIIILKSTILRNVIEPLSSVERVFNLIANALNPLVQQLKDIALFTVAIFSAIGQQLKLVFQNTFTVFEALLLKAIAKVKTFVSKIDLKATFVTVVKDLEKFLTNAFSNIKIYLKEIDVFKVFPNLEKAFDYVSNWAEKVSKTFWWLYDDVIGHSSVPDLINMTVAWFKRLGDKPLKAVKSFTNDVANGFASTSSKVKAMLFTTGALLTAFSRIRTEAFNLSKILLKVGLVLTGVFATFSALFVLPDKDFQKKLKEMGLTFGDIFKADSVLDSLGKIKDVVFEIIKTMQYRVNDLGIVRFFKQAAGIKDIYPGTLYGTPVDTSESSRVGRGRKRRLKDKPVIGHDFLNAFPSKEETGTFDYRVGAATTIVGAISYGISKLLDGGPLRSFILSLVSTVGVVLTTGAVGSKAVNTFFQDVAYNFVEIIAKGIRLILPHNAFANPAAALSVVLKSMLLFETFRTKFMDMIKFTVTAPTKAAINLEKFFERRTMVRNLEKIQKGFTDASNQIARQVPAANAAFARKEWLFNVASGGRFSLGDVDRRLRTKDFTGLSPVELAAFKKLYEAAQIQREAIIRQQKFNSSDFQNNYRKSVAELKSGIKEISKTFKENVAETKQGIISTFANLGGIIGATGGFQLGSAIALDLGDKATSLEKLGIIFFTTTVSQAIAAAVTTALGAGLVAVFSSIVFPALAAIFGAPLVGPLLLIAGTIASLGVIFRNLPEEMANDLNKWLDKRLKRPVSEKYEKARSSYLSLTKDIPGAESALEGVEFLGKKVKLLVLSIFEGFGGESTEKLKNEVNQVWSTGFAGVLRRVAEAALNGFEGPAQDRLEGMFAYWLDQIVAFLQPAVDLFNYLKERAIYYYERIVLDVSVFFESVGDLFKDTKEWVTTVFSVDYLKEKINNLFDAIGDKFVDLFNEVTGVSVSKNSSTVPPPLKKATGGYIIGPGTGTSDSIPAMLSNGEYVVNAEQTKKFLPLLEQINSGTYSRFEKGGSVGPRVSNAVSENLDVITGKNILIKTANQITVSDAVNAAINNPILKANESFTQPESNRFDDFLSKFEKIKDNMMSGFSKTFGNMTSGNQGILSFQESLKKLGYTVSVETADKLSYLNYKIVTLGGELTSLEEKLAKEKQPKARELLENQINQIKSYRKKIIEEGIASTKSSSIKSSSGIGSGDVEDSFKNLGIDLNAYAEGLTQLSKPFFSNIKGFSKSYKDAETALKNAKTSKDLLKAIKQQIKARKDANELLEKEVFLYGSAKDKLSILNTSLGVDFNSYFKNLDNVAPNLLEKLKALRDVLKIAKDKSLEAGSSLEDIFKATVAERDAKEATERLLESQVLLYGNTKSKIETINKILENSNLDETNERLSQAFDSLKKMITNAKADLRSLGKLAELTPTESARLGRERVNELNKNILAKKILESKLGTGTKEEDDRYLNTLQAVDKNIETLRKESSANNTISLIARGLVSGFKESFVSGIKSFIRGEGDIKSLAHSLSEKIFDMALEGFTDSLFDSLNFEGLFEDAMSGLKEFFGKTTEIDLSDTIFQTSVSSFATSVGIFAAAVTANAADTAGGLLESLPDSFSKSFSDLDKSDFFGTTLDNAIINPSSEDSFWGNSLTGVLDTTFKDKSSDLPFGNAGKDLLSFESILQTGNTPSQAEESFFSNLTTGFGDFFGEASTTIADLFGESGFIGKTVSDLFGSLSSGLSSLFNFGGSGSGGIFSGLSSLFSSGSSSGGGMFSGLSSLFGSLFGGSGSSGGLFSGIGGLFSSLFGGSGGGSGFLSLFSSILPMLGFADGGFISGAGTARSDSIPAMLSNGEFVMNAASTKRYLPLLSRLNAKGFANGGVVGSSTGPRGYFLGGLISMLPALFGGAGGMLGGAGGMLGGMGGMLGGMGGMLGGMGGIFGSLLPMIMGLFQKKADGGLVKKPKKMFIGGLISALPAIASGVGGAGAAAAGAGGLFGSLAGLFGGGMGGLFSGLNMTSLLGGGGMGGFMNMFGSLMGSGSGMMGGLAGIFKMLGPIMAIINMFKKKPEPNGYATGGFVSGAGTATSDSIPAMLSNGEFVVRAGVTKAYRPLLEKMNNGGLVGFAEGGLVTEALTSTPDFSRSSDLITTRETNNNSKQQIINLNVTGDISRQTKAEIMRMIPQITTGVNANNKERGKKE